MVPRGIHKGRLVPSVVTRAPAGALVVAIGDDRTDEDLFAALPPSALAIHVGPEPTMAAIRSAVSPRFARFSAPSWKRGPTEPRRAILKVKRRGAGPPVPRPSRKTTRGEAP